MGMRNNERQLKGEPYGQGGLYLGNEVPGFF